MVEFKISTLVISFLFFLGFIMVGSKMMFHAFSVDETTRLQMDKYDSYFNDVNRDINNLDANTDIGSDSALENIKDSFFNALTLGYYKKIITIIRTFGYITNSETGMIGDVTNTFRDIVPPEVFILVGLAFIILIIFTAVSLLFYRRI